MTTPSDGAAPPSRALPAASGPLFAFAPAAVLLGATGAIVGQGYDALALILGLAGGAYLWSTGLMHPTPAGTSAGGLSAVLAGRYRNAAVGYVATLVLAIALLFLLTADVTALAASISALTPYLPIGSYPPLIALLLLAALAADRMSSLRRVPGISAVSIALVLLALVLGLVALSGPDGPGVAISTPTLGEIGTLERNLLEKRIADPAVFKPFASAYLRFDLANTLALVVCLSLGAAAIAAARAPRPGAQLTALAPRRAAALLMAILALVLIPPLAAAARRTLLVLFDAGLKAGSLPAWLSSLQASGAAVVCGASQEAGPVAIAKACGKGVGADGVMHWHDVAFGPDSLVAATLSALPETPLSNAALALLLIAAFAATVATACGAAATLHTTLSRADGPIQSHTGTRMALTAALVLLAALLAFTKPAPSATMLAWAASVAAAGLAPVILAAALQRPSGIAALIAMSVGTGLVLMLTLPTRYDPLDALAVSTAFEPMSPPALRKLTSLFTALGLASDETAKAAIVAQIDALARDNVSWGGLKPLAAGLWGILASTIVMALGQALSYGVGRLRKR